MKINFLVTIICLFCFVTNVKAQREYHSAVGLRLGAPTGITYKQFLNNSDAMELSLGRRSKGSYAVTNMSIGYQIHERDVDDFINWYYGAGAGVYFFSYGDTYTSSRNGSIGLGVNGALGLDYKFDDLPINLALEWTPTYNLGNVAQKGIRLGCFGLSVRYVLTED